MDPRTLTLRAWFASFLPVFLQGSKPSTLAEYRYSLAKWEAFTSNPPLAAIDTVVLAKWQEKLLALPLSRPTVNKHLRHVQHLLNKAGPAGPRNRDALGLVPRAAWVRPLRTLKPLPAYLRPELLNALYEAAQAATTPNFRVDAASWWQCLIVLAYNLGLRRGAILALKWIDIDFHNTLLHVPAEIDKRGVERLKPLNSCCIRHLLRIRSNEKHVFHWSHGKTCWYQQWRAITLSARQTMHTPMRQMSFNFDAADQSDSQAERTGLNVRCVHRGAIHFHDLKRTSGTVWAGHASPWIVRYMLDHGPGDVTGLYVDPTNELREKCESLPQPSAFLPDSTFSVSVSHGGENHGVVSYV